jgi:hypothetical protein
VHCQKTGAANNQCSVVLAVIVEYENPKNCCYERRCRLLLDVVRRGWVCWMEGEQTVKVHMSFCEVDGGFSQPRHLTRFTTPQTRAAPFKRVRRVCTRFLAPEERFPLNEWPVRTHSVLSPPSGAPFRRLRRVDWLSSSGQLATSKRPALPVTACSFVAITNNQLN